jgi:hypothetical protein
MLHALTDAPSKLAGMIGICDPCGNFEQFVTVESALGDTL